jgi:hypothetical protein
MIFIFVQTMMQQKWRIFFKFIEFSESKKGKRKNSASKSQGGKKKPKSSLEWIELGESILRGAREFAEISTDPGYPELYKTLKTTINETLKKRFRAENGGEDEDNDNEEEEEEEEDSEDEKEEDDEDSKDEEEEDEEDSKDEKEEDDEDSKDEKEVSEKVVRMRKKRRGGY